MIRKIAVCALLSLSVLIAPAAAQVGFGMDMGVGARALSFAGNHTAAANDLSAAYWNPAALAYLPVREFQFSFDAMRTYGTCGITGSRVVIPPGAVNDDFRNRYRLGNAGAMTAIPTVQGGLTIAAAFESPKSFDDFSVYEYNMDGVHYEENVAKYGDLNRFNLAFGVQIAPQISAGLALSVVTGGSEAVYDQKKDRAPYNDMQFNHSYLGYSTTLGLLYLPTGYLKLGMRFHTLMNLDVKETGSYKYYEGVPGVAGIGRPTVLSELKGKAYVAPNGAIGAALTLPWLTAALDLRATLPYTFVLPNENIAPDLQARYFKMGGGFGFEAPVPATSLVLRAGYSFDECDLFQIVHKFGENDEIGWEEIDWEEGRGFEVLRNKHTLTLGAGLFTSGLGLELTYAWQTWGIAHTDGVRRLEQIYNNHRLMAAIIFRY